MRSRAALACLAAAAAAVGLVPRAPGATANGQEAEAGKDVYLLPDTILVEALKSPTSIASIATATHLIGRARLTGNIGDPIPEILAFSPGMHAFDLSGSGGQGLVESRGFTSFGRTSYLQVMVDGVSIGDLERDHADWSLLGAGQIERVEILRGPLSFLHGNGAMGGAVNLVTHRPRRGLRAWSETSGGSRGEIVQVLGVSVGRGPTDGTLSLMRRLHDGTRDRGAEAATGATLALRRRLAGGGSLRGRLLAHHARAEIPGPLPESLLRSDPRATWDPFAEDLREQDAVIPSLEWTMRPSSDWETTVLVQGDLRHREATETVVPVGTLDQTATSRSWSGEARSEWRPRGGAISRLLAGLTAGGGDLASRTFDPGGERPWESVGAADVSRTTTGTYVWLEIARGARSRIQAGARWDGLRSDARDPTDPPAPIRRHKSAALSPSVAMLVSANARTDFFVSAARSFKAPTLEQLHDSRPYDLDGPGPMPGITLSSTDLSPQRGTHLEAGTRIDLHPSLRMEGSVYHARSTDEIGFDLARFRYDNIERSAHTGIEWLCSLSGGRISFAEISYAWTRARFDGGLHDGNQINGVPIHRWAAQARVAIIGPASLTAGLRHIRGTWIDEENLRPIDDATLIDLGVLIQREPLTLSAAFRNLLDAETTAAGYVTFDAQGNRLPLYYPGPPRSIRIGLRVEMPS